MAILLLVEHIIELRSTEMSTELLIFIGALLSVSSFGIGYSTGYKRRCENCILNYDYKKHEIKTLFKS